MLAVCAAAGLLAPQQQWGVQQWELSTLHDRIHKGSVAKIAIHSHERAVEVLDVNGMSRRVHIFPDAVPMLVSDMRQNKVTFFVVPDKEERPSPLVPLACSFASLGIVVWVIHVLGMVCSARAPNPGLPPYAARLPARL